MAAFYAIGYSVRNVNRKALIAFSLALAVFVGYDDNIGDRFVLLRIFVFILYLDWKLEYGYGYL